MKRFIISFIFILVFLLLFTSCSDFIYQKNDFYTGKTLSSEDIESIKVKVQETTTAPYETNIDGEIVVYWTSGGTVYHYDRNCSSLSKSKAVESGTIEDAKAAGKAKPCSFCGKNIADAE